MYLHEGKDDKEENPDLNMKQREHELGTNAVTVPATSMRERYNMEDVGQALPHGTMGFTGPTSQGHVEYDSSFVWNCRYLTTLFCGGSLFRLLHIFARSLDSPPQHVVVIMMPRQQKGLLHTNPVYRHLNRPMKQLRVRT